MPPLRSRVTTQGRNAAGARALWRATGMTDSDFGKPIVAIANSYTQFVPGHVHLKDMGELVARAPCARRAASRGSSTPSRWTTASPWGTAGCCTRCPRARSSPTASSTWSRGTPPTPWSASRNCDKITPGMLNAAMRLNIPTVFVSGGPMEAGKAVVVDGVAQAPTDLITAISASASPDVDDEGLDRGRALRLPDLRLLLGHVHRQLDELPHRGARALAAGQRLHAGHPRRRARRCSSRPGAPSSTWPGATTRTTTSPCCRARSRTGTPSRTRWRSTSRWAARPTPCCTSSPPRTRPRSTSTLADIDAVSRRVPCLSKVAPNSNFHMEDVHRAGGIPAILGELYRGGTAAPRRPRGPRPESRGSGWGDWDIRAETPSEEAVELFHAAPGGVRTTEAVLDRATAGARWTPTPRGGCIRDVAHAYTADGGLAVLHGNLATDGAVIKTAGIARGRAALPGPGARRREPGAGRLDHPQPARSKPGDVVVVRYEGPAGGPGMQEMLHPTAFLKGAGLGAVCALITDGRFSGGSSGIVGRARLPRGRRTAA